MTGKNVRLKKRKDKNRESDLTIITNNQRTTKSRGEDQVGSPLAQKIL